MFRHITGGDYRHPQSSPGNSIIGEVGPRLLSETMINETEPVEKIESILLKKTGICWFSLMLNLLFVFHVPLAAQDSHYWTNHYGTEAQLLGGLVIGNVSDLSSTYYNPGSMALSSDERLVISTDAVEFINISIEERASKEIESLYTRPTPGIFALRFWSDSLQINHLAFSYLVRRNFIFEFESVFSDTREINQNWPGPELYFGEFYAFNRLSESWGGITWSRTFSDNVGFGITQYVAVKSHQFREQAIAQATGESNAAASATYIKRWKYYHVRLLWKMGFVISGDRLSAGITVTTPSIGLFGSASAFGNISRIISDTEPLLLSGIREDLDVSYRSPFSIAIGIAYRIARSRIYISAEYFDHIIPFTVIDGGTTSAAPQTDNLELKFQHNLRQVFNIGLGLQHELTEDVALYTSFSTNNSGFNPDQPSDMTRSPYDIYQLTLGSSFAIYNFKLTLGVGLGFGSGNLQGLVSPVAGGQSDGLLEQNQESKIHYTSLKLLLGVSAAL